MPVALTNAYLRGFSFMEVFYGIKSRLGKRMANPSLRASKHALMLAVMEPSSGRALAVVELEMRRPNGKVPGNFPIENMLRWSNEVDAGWQPYLCNLAVAEDVRGKGLGKQLTRLAENIVKNIWGYQQLFLHVDLRAPAPSSLYKSLGYKDLPDFDSPGWVRDILGMPEIRYQVKQLSTSELQHQEGEAARHS
ncbi:unnamed protein product [Chrysoparadoxa australica]